MKSGGTQSILTDPKRGAFSKYRAVTVGDKSIFFLMKYEFIMMLCSGMPGALGLLLRQKLYPGLLRSCGKGVAFGRNVAIRNPHRISIGRGSIIEENATLDAKGAEGDGITIGEGVFLGKGTIISTTDGTIEIDDGANISNNCRIGTIGTTRVGKKVLLAAYCYLVGAGHEVDDLDTAILDQPNTSQGGCSVGDGSWLGTRVTVMDGAHIENDCIVGAHSLVTKSIPAYSIALGTPAVVKKNRKD